MADGYLTVTDRLGAVAFHPAGGDRFQITVSDHGIGPVLDDARAAVTYAARAVTAW